MLKKFITSADACDLLNELLKLDYECITALISHREKCNEAIASHPSVQVHQYIDDQFPKVGLIGILNGLFGIREDGMGSICCDMDNAGHIKGFKPTPKPHVEY
jgi:hypothetical protein